MTTIRQLLAFFLLIALCTACEPEAVTYAQPVSDDYELTIELPADLEVIPRAEMKALAERGEEILDDVSGGRVVYEDFRSILELKRDDDAFMVVVGKHSDKLYGPFAEARDARAKLYMEQYRRETDIVERVERETTAHVLGEVPVQKNALTIVFKPLVAGIRPDPMQVIVYEGLLSPTEYITLSLTTRDEAFAKDLVGKVEAAEFRAR